MRTTFYRTPFCMFLSKFYLCQTQKSSSKMSLKTSDRSVQDKHGLSPKGICHLTISFSVFAEYRDKTWDTMSADRCRAVPVYSQLRILICISHQSSALFEVICLKLAELTQAEVLFHMEKTWLRTQDEQFLWKLL